MLNKMKVIIDPYRGGTDTGKQINNEYEKQMLPCEASVFIVFERFNRILISKYVAIFNKK